MLQQKIKDALKIARINKSKVYIEIYKVFIGEFDRIDKELTDEQVLQVLKKIKKGALLCSDLETVALCNKYLPTLFQEGDIKAKLLHIINIQNIQLFPAAFGYIMGEFNKLHKGKADNKLVAKVVKEILNS